MMPVMVPDRVEPKSRSGYMFSLYTPSTTRQHRRRNSDIHNAPAGDHGVRNHREGARQGKVVDHFCRGFDDVIQGNPPTEFRGTRPIPKLTATGMYPHRMIEIAIKLDRYMPAATPRRRASGSETRNDTPGGKVNQCPADVDQRHITVPWLSEIAACRRCERAKPVSSSSTVGG